MFKYIKKTISYLFTARQGQICLLGLGLFLGQSAYAQELPLDPAVRTGRLANGFSYYIRHNNEPQHRAELYLVNKVGSILESDKQRGLAHFLEHMAFNGTTHFPKNSLIQYLQKSGVRFGADVNAYTSFDETVFQLPIPTDDANILTNALQIMRDWANDLTLDSIEIDKERGIILEEKRLRQGAEQRISNKTLPMMVNGARYAQRLPIGTEDVLKNFSRKDIASFYKDWYRPDLQALIVVGDVDVKEMEQQIIKLFADIKMPTGAKQRVKYDIPLEVNNQFMAVTDPELSQTNLGVTIKFPEVIAMDKTSYRKAIINSIASQMISSRLAEFSKSPNIPLINISGGYGSFIANVSALDINMGLKEGQLEQGVVAGWAEISRIKKFGFTQAELSRVVQKFLASLAQQWNEKDKRPSASFVREYQNYFLKGEAAPGIEVEDKLAKEILAGLKLDEINSLVSGWIKDQGRDILITAPDKSKATLPTEQLVLSWLDHGEKIADKAYTEQTTATTLLSNLPQGGKVIQKKVTAGIDVTELTLSNGVKVVLKPTDFQNDAIQFTSFKAGGSSLYPDKDFQSASSASGIVAASGAGRYNDIELGKILNGKRARVAPYISEYYQGVNGGSSVKDLETSLQLVYLYLTSPRVDADRFRKIITDAETDIKNRYQSPDNVFNDTVSTVMGSYHFRRSAPTVEKLKAINLDRVSQIYKERFADANGFTFVFTGNFKVDSIAPLLAKYLGALPATSKKETYKDLGIHMPKGKVEKTVFKGKEDKATVLMVFNGDFKPSPEHNLELNALEQILNFRLIERLREDQGGVYTPGVNSSTSTVPAARYNLVVNFGCAPKNVDLLVNSTLEEMRKLKNNGISADDLLKFKTEEGRQGELNLRNNGFWLKQLSDSYKYNTDAASILNEKALLDKLTAEELKKAAQIYFSEQNYSRFVLLPENQK